MIGLHFFSAGHRHASHRHCLGSWNHDCFAKRKSDWWRSRQMNAAMGIVQPKVPAAWACWQVGWQRKVQRERCVVPAERQGEMVRQARTDGWGCWAGLRYCLRWERERQGLHYRGASQPPGYHAWDWGASRCWATGRCWHLGTSPSTLLHRAWPGCLCLPWQDWVSIAALPARDDCDRRCCS